MTTTVLGKTRFDIKGQWNVGTTYASDDLVLYKNSWYRAKSAVVAGTLPTDTTYFDQFYQTFNWRGIHVNTVGTTYKAYDVVEFKFDSQPTAGSTGQYNKRTQRQVYICISDHTSDGTNATLPHKSALWKQISTESNNPSASVDETTAVSTDNLGVNGNDWQKCFLFANEGQINDQHPQYIKGHKTSMDTRHNLFWIDRAGGVQTIGHTSNGSSGNHDSFAGPAATTISFHFHDWYRSTDNGGTGTLTTPDGLPPKAIQIESTIDHTTVLFNNGEVYAWGYNGNYECGERTTTNRWMPFRVGGSYGEVATGNASHVLRDVKIVRISQAGGNGAANNDSAALHTLALDSAGQVWAWGYNGYGQCGTGDTTSQVVPYKIPQSYFNNETVVAIWAFAQNYGVSYAYTSAGKFYAWGYNNYGQLGNGNTSNQNRPVLITAIDFTNAAVGTLQKVQFAGNQNYHFAGLLTSTGRVYMTGYNGNGQLCDASTTNRSTWQQVTTGPGSGTSATCQNFWILGNASQGVTMFRSATTGETFVCGYNGQYNLGDGTTTSRNVAVNALKRVYGVTTNLTNVKQAVATGGNQYNSYMVLTDEGRVFGCGWNGDGQLGFGIQDNYTGTMTASPNGIEYESRAEWQPVMVNACMTGKNEFGETMVEAIMGYGGTDQSTTRYSDFAFRSRYGRMMVQGQGGNTPGQIGILPMGWGGSGNYNTSTMIDIIQNG